ncbi:uncharacterized protein E5676_scaffold110G00980 [Cucumis melo var. makuwa]|uniref:Uncharacterized protein n=1 Tax=Cucumis melo var. makuwa TaxID=1194695 RepID=A0A5A7T3R8_CUCMM|nr:uncharacterized protein E6C27_scaffold20G00250 [Cucumis melo var. makuwa]TYJ95813.1 uncharacterized protein E5676_scaffold110G00980 [Cucumis melo var. makuwa]
MRSRRNENLVFGVPGEHLGHTVMSADNNLLIVVDSVSAGDVGNTLYLSSELPRAQDSRNETGVINLDAFESTHTGIPIRVGSMFRNKSVLKKAIYMFAVNNSFELVTIRSNRTSFDIRYKDSFSPWQATSWIVSECTKSFFKMFDKAPCRPSDIINYMNIHPRVNISYNKAWRGRKIALNSIRGASEDSYVMLSAFLDALIQNNPRTYTAEEADDEGHFKFYFMALIASIDA